MMTNDFFNDAVWEAAWKKDPDTAISKMKKLELIQHILLTIGQSHLTSRRLAKKAGEEQNG